MKPLTALSITVATGALGMTLLGGGCSERTDRAEDVLDASVDSGRPGTGAPADASDTPDTRPPVYIAGVPEGWEPLVEYSPSCGIYYPTDEKYLPPPIAWEPCSVGDKGHGLPGPDGMQCRRVAPNWPSASGRHLGHQLSMDVVGGKPMMLLRRVIGKLVYETVDDVDGKVHTALMQAGGCTIQALSLKGQKVVWSISDNLSSTDWSGGAVGGDIDTLRPRVYLPYGHLPSTVYSQEYAVGPNMFIESIATPDRIYSFDTGELLHTIVRAPEDGGLLYSGYFFHGDDLFWNGDSSSRTALKVWTKARGTQTLVGWPGDATRGADGLGTDGVDMVWTEAFGRTGGTTSDYANYETWTAKYTTDPSALAATKRRVRSAGVASYSEQYVLGCGYAAIAIAPRFDWGAAPGFRVIRLSDGVSWTAISHSQEQREDFFTVRPAAITCDEVFLRGVAAGHSQVVRIRIDSLGPGTPPD